MDILLAAATLIGGAAGFWYFRDKIANWFGGGPAVSKHDLELYEKYKNLFVTKGVADFYSQHDFLGSFQEDYWIPLSNYVDTWHSVEYEFVDKRLNSAHKKVYSSASKLGVAIAKNTVPIWNERRHKVSESRPSSSRSHTGVDIRRSQGNQQFGA